MDVAELYKEQNLSKALQSFAHQITIGPTSGSSHNQMRLRYPAGSQQIKKIQESTRWVFELKGTDYLFELAKHDTYLPDIRDESQGRYNPMLSQQTMAKVPITTWNATIRHRDWDSTLAEQARMRPGQAASWTPSLKVFFPPDARSTVPDKTQGFWHFWDQVERVAHFLSGMPKLEGTQANVEPYGDLGIVECPKAADKTGVVESLI